MYFKILSLKQPFQNVTSENGTIRTINNSGKPKKNALLLKAVWEAAGFCFACLSMA